MAAQRTVFDEGVALKLDRANLDALVFFDLESNLDLVAVEFFCLGGNFGKVVALGAIEFLDRFRVAGELAGTDRLTLEDRQFFFELVVFEFVIAIEVDLDDQIVNIVKVDRRSEPNRQVSRRK